jgi:ribonuclease P protein component
VPRIIVRETVSIQESFKGTVIASVPEESDKSARQRARKFPRSGRLLRHSDYERVYKQGRRHFSASMMVFYWQRPDEVPNGSKPAVAPGLRIGFTVGRVLGGAVQRNRIKRRLREAVRLTRPVKTPNADVVINPKKSVLTLDFEVLLNEIRQAFVVIEKKLSPNRGA